MYNFLLQLPDIYLFLLISFSFIIISIIITLVVRVSVPSHIRSRDNAIIVGTSNLISLIYGILVGLSALYLINNISYTADAVQREANAIADIYHNSEWLSEPIKSTFEKKLTIYLNSVINTEWHLMQRGKEISNKNDFLISSMKKDAIDYHAANNTEQMLQRDILTNLQNLYNARQQRIHMSYSMLNPDLWVVIIIGTILTLCINYIYDMNFYLHLVTISAAALMTASMLFLLIALDGPFQGEFVIDSSSMQAVLTYIEQSSPSSK